uniref:Diphthine--ammonia ligase n=1 Tax=Pristionchus pacificus TaxID=54126 RepID=A0A8R1V2D8_PRIPA
MYNMMCAVKEGWKIVSLANLHPVEEGEMDSFMYQTVGSEGIEMIAQSMDLPLYRQSISGRSLTQSMEYEKTEGDEVEDLFNLLTRVKDAHPNVRGVSVGAILSSYQKLRVENVCSRLGLIPMAYLWERDQEELLHEMIENGVNAILIKVAALGLNEKHLGKTLGQMEDILLKLRDKFGVHPCGEGGDHNASTRSSGTCRISQINSIKTG